MPARSKSLSRQSDFYVALPWDGHGISTRSCPAQEASDLADHSQSRRDRAFSRLCRELIGMSKMEPMPEAADKDYRDIYEELTGVSLCQCPACRTAIRCCSAPFGRSPRFH